MILMVFPFSHYAVFRRLTACLALSPCLSCSLSLFYYAAASHSYYLLHAKQKPREQKRRRKREEEKVSEQERDIVKHLCILNDEYVSSVVACRSGNQYWIKWSQHTPCWYDNHKTVFKSKFVWIWITLFVVPIYCLWMPAKRAFYAIIYYTLYFGELNIINTCGKFYVLYDNRSTCRLMIVVWCKEMVNINLVNNIAPLDTSSNLY